MLHNKMSTKNCYTITCAHSYVICRFLCKIMYYVYVHVRIYNHSNSIIIVIDHEKWFQKEHQGFTQDGIFSKVNEALYDDFCVSVYDNIYQRNKYFDKEYSQMLVHFHLSRFFKYNIHIWLSYSRWCRCIFFCCVDI